MIRRVGIDVRNETHLLCSDDSTIGKLEHKSRCPVSRFVLRYIGGCAAGLLQIVGGSIHTKVCN